MTEPVDDDIRHDDLEYNPAIEPRKAKAWLNLLDESEKAFEDYNDHCDKIDERYASIKRLATLSREKEFQLFWANCEVLKPAIYAKTPVPVVVPKFKDQRPVYEAASEVLERCASVAFDLAYVNETLLQARDDLAIVGRGVAWCRYESGKGNEYYDSERVCIDFKHRRDFLHSISRCWYEVSWVAAASYLTRAQARERFYRHSGDAYQDAEYRVDKDSKEVGGADSRERAKFWEIWHKTEKRVVWVAKGCEDILDEDDPHLQLAGFFPCPKPAYGSCQRGSLIPVPDVLQYKDQLDEIDLLTAKIHALSDALEVRGFYPAGGAELSDAVQAALATHTPGRVLVPISNWAAFGGSKEVIIWLPIDMIAETITGLVTLRKQLIDDVYQIMGLSDIMRGATDARETFGAQELKTQYGSSRVRDKQYELARLARDLVQITCEIITEKFDGKTIVAMSQTQLPTKAMQEREVGQLHQQAMAQMQQLAREPQAQQMVQQNPGQAQAALAQAQSAVAEQISKIMGKPTIDQVLDFLTDNRARAFTLDIETDSTVIADENAEKQRRTEFVGMLGQLLPQLANMIAADPMTAEFCGDVLKFATASFRSARPLDASIDDLVEQMKAKANAPRGDDPTTAQNKTALQIEQMKTARQADKDKADTQLKAAELAMRDQHEKMKIASNEKLKLMEMGGRRNEDAAKAQQTNLKMMADREQHQMDMIGKAADLRSQQQKSEFAVQQAQARQADMAARANERRAAAAVRPPPGGGGPV